VANFIDAVSNAQILNYLTGRKTMPLFISRGNYTQTAIAGMMAKPEDRSEALSSVLKKVGGKLHAMYNTLGEYDFLIIAEAPSEKDMVSVLLVGAGTGSLANLNTTLAWTTAEAKDAFAKAQTLAMQFRPAGRA
jgi:uncharacterized protein with GYD domain